MPRYAPDKVWRASTEASEVQINIFHANYRQHSQLGKILHVKVFMSDVVLTFLIGNTKGIP